MAGTQEWVETAETAEPVAAPPPPSAGAPATHARTQTSRELVEKALVVLGLAPSFPSAASAVYEHLNRVVPRPRVREALQEIAQEERDEEPSLLDP